MRVSDLIEELENMPGDMEVMVQYNYGDYHGTKALKNICYVSEMIPYQSAYSESGLAVRDDNDEDDEERIVVIG